MIEISNNKIAYYNEVWLNNLDQLIERSLDRSNFKIDDLVEPMMVSRSHLYRRIKKITGLSPNLYIRKFRLERAKDLLERQVYSTVQEVSWAVGFQRADYFSDLYQQVYFKRPIEYLKD